MAKRSWNWVVYNSAEEDVLVFTNSYRPKLGQYCGTWSQIGGSSARICAKEFQHTFGFLPEPNKPVKVAFTGALYTKPTR